MLWKFNNGELRCFKADFNEIAELGCDSKWNHNNCYFPYLLRQVPLGAGTCLDIGCGKGELSKLLSERVSRVIAVDIADKMIEYARYNNSAETIEYVCGNILDMDHAPSSFYIIISTATAHRLPYVWLLEFAKEKLRPGGKLIILDLAKAGSIADRLGIRCNSQYNHEFNKERQTAQRRFSYYRSVAKTYKTRQLYDNS